MKSLIEKALTILNAVADRLQSPFLQLVRLYWGWQFVETGWGKVNNIEKVTGFFTTLGIPFPGLNAHFVAGLELVGGILLILGLAARPIGLMLSVNMIVAYITADWEAVSSALREPDKFVQAAPFPFLWTSLMSLVFGAGSLSLDRWIASRKKTSEQP
ncbi:hypothetical protein F183_A31270 [Bryobacterales bacterium F-183]|nr:hypothetical protein F183_A31270 [Bryobacterales bacterium F-183]